MKLHCQAGESKHGFHSVERRYVNSYTADNQFSADILHISFHFAGDIQLMAVECNTLVEENDE